MGLFNWFSGEKKRTPRVKYPPIKCPQCGSLNPDSTIKCACGYIFPMIPADKTEQQASEKQQPKKQIIKEYPPTRLLYFDREDPIDPDWGKAAFVDVETTGLDPTTEEIVELSIMLFAYDKGNGKIFGVLEEYTGRREPSKPIPKEAYKIHGITDKEVKGKQLEYNRIESLIQKAEFLVAHNASFDREFVSNLYPFANQKQWRCSMGGVAWRKYGYKSAALQNLLQDHKIKVPQAHRANLDIEAALLLLSQISEQGKPYFFEILQYNKRMPNRYIDAKRINERKVDELIGICKGVTADGVLTVEEVQILVKWLESNKNATSKWPGNILAERIKEIVSDGIINENELTELFQILKKTMGGIPELNLPTSLPFDNPEPEVTFNGKIFCFTGNFSYGTRDECESEVINRGGIVQSNPTRKTNYLVLGSFGNEEWIHSLYGRKIEHVIRQKSKGFPIAIVSEEHWAKHLEI